MCMSLLSNALYYASLGWPVFPLAPRSKKPQKDFPWLSWASVIHEDIERFWDETPDANVGVVCRNCIVFDIDPRNGGMESVEYLKRNGMELPVTAVSRTRSGGFHYVLGLSISFPHKSKPWPGIDVLGPAQYFVAPPSVTPDGDYRWIRGRAPWQTRVAGAPEWLLEAIRRQPPKEPERAEGSSKCFEQAARYVAKMPPAISGQGGHTTTFVSVKKLISAFPELADDEVMGLLADWNATCRPPWSEAELARKITEARK